MKIIYAAILTGLGFVADARADRPMATAPDPKTPSLPKTVHAFSEHARIEMDPAAPGEYFMRTDQGRVSIGKHLDFIPVEGWTTVTPRRQGTPKGGFFGSAETLGQELFRNTKQTVGSMAGLKLSPSERRPVFFAVRDPKDASRVVDVMVVRADGYWHRLGLPVEAGESLNIAGALEMDKIRYVSQWATPDGFDGALSFQIPIEDVTQVPPKHVGWTNQTITSDLQYAFDEYLDKNLNVRVDPRKQKAWITNGKPWGDREVLAKGTGAPPEGKYSLQIDAGAGGGGAGGAASGSGAGGGAETPRSMFNDYFSHDEGFLERAGDVEVPADRMRRLEARLQAPRGSANSIVMVDDLGVDGPETVDALLRRIREGQVAGIPADVPMARIDLGRLKSNDGHYLGKLEQRINGLKAYAHENGGRLILHLDNFTDLTMGSKEQPAIISLINKEIGSGEFTVIASQPADAMESARKIGIDRALLQEAIPPATAEELAERMSRQQGQRIRTRLESSLGPKLKAEGKSAEQIAQAIEAELPKHMLPRKMIDNVYYYANRLDPVGHPMHKALGLLDHVVNSLESETGKLPSEVSEQELKEFINKHYNVPKWAWDKTAYKAQRQELSKSLDEMIGQDAVKEAVRGRYSVYNPRHGSKGGMRADFFGGPPSLGKTEMGKKMAKGLGRKYVRIDMGNFGPGAEGTVDDLKALLAAELKKDPFTYFLFDEIEKARRDIRNGLFDVLSNESMTVWTAGPNGRKIPETVRVSDSIGVFTSNLGEDFIFDAFERGLIPPTGMNDLRPIPEYGGKTFAEAFDAHVSNQLGEHAFLSRIRRMFPFIPYNADEYSAILQAKMNSVLSELQEHVSKTNVVADQIKLEMTNAKEVADAIALEYFKPGGEIRKGQGIAEDIVRHAVGLLEDDDNSPLEHLAAGSRCEVRADYLQQAMDLLLTKGASAEKAAVRASKPHHVEAPHSMAPDLDPLPPPPSPSPSPSGPKRVFRRTISEDKASPKPPVAVPPPEPKPKLPSNVIPFPRK
jgi:hypothetical protein